MSDLNEILDEILNNRIYSTDEQYQQETELNSRIRSSNDEVPNSNESDDEDDLDQSDTSKNQSTTKVTNESVDETDEVLQRNLQPRRFRRKSEENDDDDENDCQHVPNVNVPEKMKTLADDENNRDHPTYVPRKGKFFEHDDRTSNEHKSTKQDIARSKIRTYRDAEGKWPHDLYYRDQQVLKSTRHGTRPGHVVNRTYQSNHSDDHLPSTLRRPPGFTTKEQHPTHYQRKFINRQYQQTDKGSVQQQTPYRRERQQSLPSTENKNKDQQRKPNRHVEVKVDPIRQRTSRPKSHHEGLENRSKFVHHQSEQPKRYSNMRQTLSHSRPVQQPMNVPEQNDWPQVPLSPLTYFSQQTKTTSSYWYPQTSPDVNSGRSPQVSRYFPTASAFQDQ